ncbi:MAG: hypothetical protein BZY80_06495 [SAR202 cluster bacterium Io17-Chloro-G2]|nr:MAG: hypothetical protein BZY80_06495 [SAR202 cluster bacterium Io17-Chloro-G2]
MGPLKLKEPENVTTSYDKEADVLYISFGKPTPSLTLDLGRGLLARYIEETGDITGFTLLGVSEVTNPREL